MRLPMICLALTLSGAPVAAASGPACAPLFWPVTYLEPDSERAWVRLRDGLKALAKVDVAADLLTWMRQKHFGRSAFRDGLALAIRPMADYERARLCQAITPLLLETNAVTLDAELAFYLLDQFCGLESQDVLGVTEGALSVPESPQLRRWFDLLADARVRGRPALSPGQWRALIRKSESLVLTTFVRDRYADLGLNPDDLTGLAQRLIRAGRSVRFVLGQTGLPRDRAAGLIRDLDALQWIEYRHWLGLLNDSAVDAADAPGLPRRPPSVTHVHQVLADVLFDVNVPYPVFERVLKLAKAYWRYGSNEPLPPLPYLPPPRALTPGQLERVTAFFGIATVQPEVVARAGLRFARAIESHSLNRVAFEDAADFVDVFALERHTSFPPAREDGRFDPETLQQVRAMANLYFRRLRRELPKFLALAPDAAQVRWLLETPVQFAPAPLNLDVDLRWRWLRAVDVRDGVFNTAAEISKLQNDALDWAMPRVRTLDEWTSLLSFRRLPSFSNDIARRTAVARYFFEGVRVGPEDLSWLDLPLAREATVASQVLGELRTSVPPGLRSDERLMARAMQMLTGEHVSASVSRASAVDRRPDEEAAASFGLDRRDQVLLEYLHARGRAGALAHVRPRALARLRALAYPHGYAIIEEARDFASVAVRVERRPR